MRNSCTLYVGLDVYKDSIGIAVAQAPREAEVRHLGSVPGGLDAVSKALRKLVSAGNSLHIVYEAVTSFKGGGGNRLPGIELTAPDVAAKVRPCCPLGP